MVDDLNTSNNDDNGTLPDDEPITSPSPDNNPLSPPDDLPLDDQQVGTTHPVQDQSAGSTIQPESVEGEDLSGFDEPASPSDNVTEGNQSEEDKPADSSANTPL